MLKKVIVAIMVAIPMLLSAQTVKIGVVDTQTIIPDLPAYKDAQTKLGDVSKKYETEYNKLRDEAQKKFEEFQNLPQDTPEAVKERRAKELDEFSQKLQEFEQMAQQDIQKQQQDLMVPLYNSIQQAIQSVAKEGGFTIVQDAQALLYFAEPAVNITPDVRKRLGLSAQPAAAPAK